MQKPIENARKEQAATGKAAISKVATSLPCKKRPKTHGKAFRRRQYNSTDFAINIGFANFALRGFTMNRRTSIFMTILTAVLIMSAAMPVDCHAQLFRRKKEKKAEKAAKAPAPKPQKPQEDFMEFIVEGEDTIYIDHIRAAKVYSKLPKMKGREWRQYYRLVHNFSKAYPYALVARKLVQQADSTIAADNLKRGKRDRYVDEVQKELFSVFESQMRSLTVSQGALIMKLVDREVGKSSYSIIKDYKSGIAAGFWQGIAKIFGSDLKAPYDPEGEDAATEELVQIWEAGDFPAFYWSIFWKDPPEVPIPEKYL